jgi:hypothetical protein
LSADGGYMQADPGAGHAGVGRGGDQEAEGLLGPKFGPKQSSTASVRPQRDRTTNPLSV